MTTTLKDDREIIVKDDKPQSLDGALGVFATVSLLLLLWGFCWLKNYSSFTQPQFINVRFHEVAGLNDNAGVFVDGVRVGIVDEINWIARRTVILKIRINSKVVVPSGAKFSILTNGIVGAKYVEITLPEDSDGKPVSDKQIVIGEDPVRPELAVNNLAIGLSEIDVKQVRKTLSEDHDRLVKTTEHIDKLIGKSYPLIEQTLPLEKKAIVLADQMNRMTRKLTKLVDNPNFSGDIKETATQIRVTMEHVQEVMKQVNTTLGDKSLRNDIYATLAQLNQATDSLEKSMEVVQSMSTDGQLRSDVKQMLRDARDAMTKVDKIVTDPNFGVDLKETLGKTRNAIDHIDTAAQQMNQILNKRSPLIQMLIGRPGKIKKSMTDKTTSKTANSAPTDSKTEKQSDTKDSDKKAVEAQTSKSDGPPPDAIPLDAIPVQPEHATESGAPQ